MLTEKQLIDILVGIAKAQVAVARGVTTQTDLALLSRLRSSVGALTSTHRHTTSPLTFEDLTAHLFLKALSTPGPHDETLEQFAAREVHRLTLKRLTTRWIDSNANCVDVVTVNRIGTRPAATDS